nr:hypothetical protein [Ktedonobacter racemifer]
MLRRAFTTIGSVIPLNVGIFVGSMRRAHVGPDPQAQQEPTQRRGEIPA